MQRAGMNTAGMVLIWQAGVAIGPKHGIPLPSLTGGNKGCSRMVLKDHFCKFKELNSLVGGGQAVSAFVVENGTKFAVHQVNGPGQYVTQSSPRE